MIRSVSRSNRWVGICRYKNRCQTMGVHRQRIRKNSRTPTDTITSTTDTNVYTGLVNSTKITGLDSYDSSQLSSLTTPHGSNWGVEVLKSLEPTFSNYVKSRWYWENEGLVFVYPLQLGEGKSLTYDPSTISISISIIDDP